MSFSVLDSLPSVEEEDTAQKAAGSEDRDEDMEHPETCFPVEEEDVDKIVACLEEIHRLFAYPQHLIVSEGASVWGLQLHAALLCCVFT